MLKKTIESYDIYAMSIKIGGYFRKKGQLLYSPGKKCRDGLCEAVLIVDLVCKVADRKRCPQSVQPACAGEY